LTNPLGPLSAVPELSAGLSACMLKQLSKAAWQTQLVRNTHWLLCAVTS
jgi:hypothetical protein